MGEQLIARRAEAAGRALLPFYEAITQSPILTDQPVIADFFAELGARFAAEDVFLTRGAGGAIALGLARWSTPVTRSSS